MPIFEVDWIKTRITNIALHGTIIKTRQIQSKRNMFGPQGPNIMTLYYVNKQHNGL